MDLEESNNVYIVGISSILPNIYPNTFIIDTLYSKQHSSDLVRRFAKRLVSQTGIVNKPSVLDFSIFPQKKLLREEYTVQNWGRQILINLSALVDLSNVGYFGVTYDVSSHKKKIPNLACQIAMENNLVLDVIPEEFAYYGCGSSVLALKSAVSFCRRYNRAAIVFVFSQASWLCDPIYDSSDIYFKDNLRANLIFGDGAVGILLVPENMLCQKHEKRMRILDIEVGFELGEEIKMTHEGRFLVNDKIKNILPELISRRILLPMLKRNGLFKSQIEEWSVHQGGFTILEMFKDANILGLTDLQLSRSRLLFERYGNLSTISSVFVLSNFFNETFEDNKYGMLVGFGAGYYFGTMLYKSNRAN